MAQPVAHLVPSSAALPRRVSSRPRGRRSLAVRAGGVAAFEDVEQLWGAVHIDATTKERCWFAAYDAPFHGVPSGPYMGGRVADMNAHIAKRHRVFLERSRRELCGHEIAPQEFAEALERMRSVLGVGLDGAVKCVFGEPSLLAADKAELVRGLVTLRIEHEGEDIAELVVKSRGALLAGAAHVVCEAEDDDRASAADDDDPEDLRWISWYSKKTKEVETSARDHRSRYERRLLT